MSIELLATIGDLEFERRKLLAKLDAAHARIAELEAQRAPEPDAVREEQ